MAPGEGWPRVEWVGQGFRMAFGRERVRACRSSAWARGGVPALGAMGLLAVPHPVLAQVVPARPPVAPSQVTPRSLMPPPSMMPPSVDLPLSLPSEAPSGADTTAVTVGAVVVTGGYPELAAQTRALFAPLEGKRCHTRGIGNGSRPVRRHDRVRTSGGCPLPSAGTALL